MQQFHVAGGIVIDEKRVLLVQNRRRNGSLDWSTPGGVVDDGETPLGALTREVTEETALVVRDWSPLIYSVEVEFVERRLGLLADVHLALGWDGSLHVDDPDHVVVDGRFMAIDEAVSLLASGPRWVSEPLTETLTTLDTLGTGLSTPPSSPPRGSAGSEASPPTAVPTVWRYRVIGPLGQHTVERVES